MGREEQRACHRASSVLTKEKVIEAVFATAFGYSRLDRAGIDIFRGVVKTEKVHGVGHIRLTSVGFTREHRDDIIASARIGRRRRWSKFPGVTS